MVWICCTPIEDHHLPSAPPTKKPSVQTISVSQEDTDSEKDLALGRKSPPSPSPLASIGSQDSSAFTYTYNPNSKGSVENSKSGFFGSSFVSSSSQVEIDVEAWQRGSTVSSNASLPFGHDISAITTKRDLSLIEEGDEDRSTSRQSEGSRSRLSAQAIDELERQERRKRSRLNLNGSARAVIDDLNDLSAQIDDYRRR